MTVKKLVKAKAAKTPALKPLRLPVAKKLTPEEFGLCLKWNTDGSASCTVIVDIDNIKDDKRAVSRRDFLASIHLEYGEHDGSTIISWLFESAVTNGITIDCPGEHRCTGELPHVQYELRHLDGNTATLRADISFAAIECWIFIRTREFVKDIFRHPVALKNLTADQRAVMLDIAGAYIFDCLTSELYSFDYRPTEEHVFNTAHEISAKLFNAFQLPFVPAAWYKTRSKLSKERWAKHLIQTAEFEKKEAEKRKAAVAQR
jgi:hypothetical protein